MEDLVILGKMGGEGVGILLVEGRRNQHDAEDQAPRPSPRLGKTAVGGLRAQEEPGLAISRTRAFTQPG